MEHMFSQRGTSPLDPPPPSCQEKPQYTECQLYDSSADHMSSSSATTVNGGSQNAPEMVFQTIQWPPESPMDYAYPGCFDRFQIQEPGNVSGDLSDMDPIPSVPRFWNFDMSANQISDPGRGHLMSLYDLPPRDQGIPRLFVNQTDRVPATMERNCHSADQPLVSREVMFGLTATAGNSTTQNINWLQGPQAVNQQSKNIGSGLVPHARPSGLGNEYVSYILDHARCTDPKLLPDHQAKGFNNTLAHRPKPNNTVADTRRLLRPKGTCLGRRKSVPRCPPRKRSSVDQGIDHIHLFQERTQIAGTQVFDTNMKTKPSRKKRRFSEGEKERIARVRKIGACSECRPKKRRVLHS